MFVDKRTAVAFGKKHDNNPRQACRKMQQPKASMWKMAATQGRHAGRMQQPRAGMYEDGSNPGQACRKKAAIQSRNATRKLQVQIRHALRWLHGACTVCRKMEAT